MRSQPLTYHLKDVNSPVTQFLKQRFPRTASITKETNIQLRSAGTINPGFPPSMYGLLGTAIDYRIRYSFAITPGRQLAAWKGAMSLIFKALESEDDIPLSWDDIPEGIGVPTNEYGEITVTQGPYPLKLLQAFFNRLDAQVETIAPVGKRLKDESEKLLARYCYALSLFEQLYRNRRSYQHSPLLIPAPKQSIDELLEIPKDVEIDDLCAMSWLFYDRYHDRLSLPCILNPGFTGYGAVSQSDADLIVDGCLIEIKTSIHPEIERFMLWQLAGYLLLDHDDKYSIDSVGVYMARQGNLFEWSIADFLRLLTGDNTVTLPQLRQEFRTLAEKGVEEKRKMAQTLQTRTVVEPSTARHWIARVSLDIAVLNAVLDNKLKMDDLNISELQKETEKFSKIITSAISTVPHDIDNTVLERVKCIEQELVALWEKTVLIDGSISMEELIFMVRQLQITMVDVVSFLRSTVR